MFCIQTNSFRRGTLSRGEVTNNHVLLALAEERQQWRRTVDMKLIHTTAWILFVTGLGRGAALGSVFGEVGENLTVVTQFSFAGVWRIFCKHNCSRGNILIETIYDFAQAGRFSLRHERTGMVFIDTFVTVGVAALSTSDGGLYLCGLIKGSSYIYTQFHIVVVDVVLKEDPFQESLPLVVGKTGRSLTVACSFTSSGGKKYFCKESCYGENILAQTNGARKQNGRFLIDSNADTGNGDTVSVSIDLLRPSDSGWYQCSMVTNSWHKKNINFQVIVRDASPESPDSRTPLPLPENPTPSGPGQNRRSELLVPVGGTLAAVVVLLAAALLMVCRKPPLFHQDRSAERDVSFTETSQQHQGGAAQRRPSEEISSTQGDDNPGGLTYSALVFSSRASAGGAPCRTSDSVVYSQLQAACNTRDDPLYSNVTQLRRHNEY